jgi:hypothetical protein
MSEASLPSMGPKKKPDIATSEARCIANALGLFKPIWDVSDFFQHPFIRFQARENEFILSFAFIQLLKKAPFIIFIMSAG